MKLGAQYRGKLIMNIKSESNTKHKLTNYICQQTLRRSKYPSKQCGNRKLKHAELN